MHGEMPDSISKPSARDPVRLVNQSSIGSSPAAMTMAAWRTKRLCGKFMCRKQG